MKQFLLIILSGIILYTISGCDFKKKEKPADNEEKQEMKLTDKYVSVKLTTDLSVLTDKEKEMLVYLFDAADIMNDIYWKQAYGNKEDLLSGIEDEDIKKFAMINYGPWDRLNGNLPFLETFGKKPKGANFYPADMTKEEFEAFDNPDKNSLYTLIRRDEDNKLRLVWYHDAYKEETKKAAGLIVKASELAEDEGLKNYLELRAEALLNDDYRKSDFAWLDMTENTIDFVVGPVENYEDALYNKKAAHEAFILIKDKEWSKKLAKYAALLPDMQKMLPVDEKYKNETPGSSGNQLNAYDVVFYAGDCNAGSKTIAINLPNDEVVREKKGSRKLQLKNAMQAKFDKILVPISNVLINENQRKHISFDAFFTNTMFHEVGHGLGLSYLSGNKEITVREALSDYYTTIEEGKADILGLFLVTKLHESGELGEQDLMDYYLTFMASIFRSIRFGIASAHGKANMMRFYYFQEKDAFTRDDETGTYMVNFEKMQEAMNELIVEILTIQGDGDYEKAKKWTLKDGNIKEELKADLKRLETENIPVDIVFEQGMDVIGL